MVLFWGEIIRFFDFSPYYKIKSKKLSQPQVAYPFQKAVEG